MKTNNEEKTEERRQAAAEFVENYYREYEEKALTQAQEDEVRAALDSVENEVFPEEKEPDQPTKIKPAELKAMIKEAYSNVTGEWVDNTISRGAPGAMRITRGRLKQLINEEVEKWCESNKDRGTPPYLLPLESGE